jgi:hypothetical protein
LTAFKDPTQLGENPISYFNNLKIYKKEDDKIRFENGWLGRLKNYQNNYKNVLYSNRRNKPIKSYLKYRIKYMLTYMGMYNKNFR